MAAFDKPHESFVGKIIVYKSWGIQFLLGDADERINVERAGRVLSASSRCHLVGRNSRRFQEGFFTVDGPTAS